MVAYLGHQYGDDPEDVEDAFICQGCNAKGELPYRELEDTESSDEEVDQGPRQAQEHGALKVGDSYCGGAILEIYSDIDKLTVACERHNRTDIQHLKISKVAAKIHARMSNVHLDGLD